MTLLIVGHLLELILAVIALAIWFVVAFLCPQAGLREIGESKC